MIAQVSVEMQISRLVLVWMVHALILKCVLCLCSPFLASLAQMCSSDNPDHIPGERLLPMLQRPQFALLKKLIMDCEFLEGW
jgi:hypothetical protein